MFQPSYDEPKNALVSEEGKNEGQLLGRLYLNQLEFDQLHALKHRNASVEALFRQFTRVIRPYLNESSR